MPARRMLHHENVADHSFVEDKVVVMHKLERLTIEYQLWLYDDNVAAIVNISVSTVGISKCQTFEVDAVFCFCPIGTLECMAARRMLHHENVADHSFIEDKIVVMRKLSRA